MKAYYTHNGGMSVMKKIKCPECQNLVDENLKECSCCGYTFDGTEELDCCNAEQESVDEAVETEKNIEATNNCCEVSEEAIESISGIIDSAEEKTSEVSDQIDKNIQYLEPEKKKSGMSKRVLCEIIGGVALGISLICAVNFNNKFHSFENKYKDTSKELRNLNRQYNITKKENETLSASNLELNARIHELENGASKQLVDIKNAYDAGEWQKVIDLAAQLHVNYNGSSEDAEAQQLALASQDQLNQIAAQKAAEEAQGYETGISYDQLARTPGDFEGKKVKFYGKVIQVIEGDGTVQIRLAVDDNYDTVLFGEYPSSVVASRILEDDYITVYGTSVGTISYQSTLGGTITIPGVLIEKIEQ